MAGIRICRRLAGRPTPPPENIMTLKFGTWMIAVGAFLAFVGLCFPPAAFGTPRDPSVLPAGAMVFSTGMVLAAAGFYMKARYWAESETPRVRSNGKGKRRICNQCGE